MEAGQIREPEKILSIHEIYKINKKQNVPIAMECIFLQKILCLCLIGSVFH